MINRFKKIKETFVDSVNNKYIELDSIAILYKVLEKNLSEPIKIILLHGEPGTGKSTLLRKISKTLEKSKEVSYFNFPIFNEISLLKKIYEFISKKKVPKNLKINFEGLIAYIQKMKGSREIIFLLDECQLYKDDLLEKVRILSDTGVIKFIITMHSIDKNKGGIIQESHFNTRIWEVVKIENVSELELSQYVKRKFLKNNMIEESELLSKRDISYIYKFTKGNFRETNKFLYVLFDIHESYSKKYPNKFDNDTKISKKLLEMTSLKIGYLK